MLGLGLGLGFGLGLGLGLEFGLGLGLGLGLGVGGYYLLLGVFFTAEEGSSPIPQSFISQKRPFVKTILTGITCEDMKEMIERGGWGQGEERAFVKGVQGM